MSTCERVKAAECHSIALYEVILQEMWQNLLFLVGRSRLWFSASTSPLKPLFLRRAGINLTSCLNMF